MMKVDVKEKFEDKLQVIKDDPYLEPFESDLLLRRKRLEE